MMPEFHLFASPNIAHRAVKLATWSNAHGQITRNSLPRAAIEVRTCIILYCIHISPIRHHFIFIPFFPGPPLTGLWGFREWVTLSFRQPQSLGMILPLIVSLSHSWRTKGGITKLTVIILCGQDHSASRLKGAHLWRDWNSWRGHRFYHIAHSGRRRTAVCRIVISEFLTMIFTLIMRLGLLRWVQGDIAEFAVKGLTQILQGRVLLPCLW